MLYPIIPHYTPLHPITPHYTPLHPIIPQYTPIHPIIPHYTPFYPILPQYTPLFHTTLYPITSPFTRYITPHHTPLYVYLPIILYPKIPLILDYIIPRYTHNIYIYLLYYIFTSATHPSFLQLHTYTRELYHRHYVISPFATHIISTSTTHTRVSYNTANAKKKMSRAVSYNIAGHYIYVYHTHNLWVYTHTYYKYIHEVYTLYTSHELYSQKKTTVLQRIDPRSLLNLTKSQYRGPRTIYESRTACTTKNLWRSSVLICAVFSAL